MLEVFPSLTTWFFFLFLGVLSLILFLLPRIREIAVKFNFLDTPDHRSSHNSIVPTFGGIAFYIALIITIFLSREVDENNVGMVLLVSLSIMFFTGLKDDLNNLSPRMKFFGQTIAVLVLMAQSDFRMTSFHGFLGLYEMPIIISIFISAIFILTLVNAFNLIDGIDGMASMVGIVVATSLGFIFYKLNMLFYLMLCISVVSMLFGFLRFNLSPRKKIFMGDTGALLIGLMLGLLTLKLLSLGANAFQVIAIERDQLPLLLLGILFIPIFDVFRVMIIRASRKKSIFSPDRNHIHHILIDAGLSHRRASFICGVGNFVIALTMFYSIREFGLIISIIVLLFFVATFLLMFFGLNKSYNSKRNKVRLRRFLFSVSRLFSSDTTSKKIRIKRLAFNQKLKRIRILFF